MRNRDRSCEVMDDGLQELIERKTLALVKKLT
jgi:hypothetical protein